MKCGSCGCETRPGNYCENCGAKQAAAADSSQGSAVFPVNDTVVELRPLTRRTKKILVAVVLTFAVIFSCYGIILYFTSPKMVAINYLKALEAKNYTQAYGYTKADNNKMLNKDAFAAWQNNEEKARGVLKSYEDVKIKGKVQDAEANLTCTLERGSGKSEESTIKLTSKDKILGIFPRWEIELPIMTKSFDLYFKGARFYVDGRDTGLTSSMDYPVKVSLFKGSHTYEFKAKNMATISIKTNETYIEGARPDEITKKDINDAAGSLGDLVFQAYNTNDPDLLENVLRGDPLVDFKKQMAKAKEHTVTLDKEGYKAKVVDILMISSEEATAIIEITYSFKDKTSHVYYNKFILDSVRFFQRDGKWSFNKSTGSI